MTKPSQKNLGHFLGFAGVGLSAFQVHYVSQYGRRISFSLFSLWNGFFALLESFVEMLRGVLPYSVSDMVLSTLYIQDPPFWIARLLKMVPVSGFLLAVGFLLVVLGEIDEESEG